MNYNNLGRTGLKVSPLCLGLMSYGDKRWQPWVLDRSEARGFIKLALDHGINFFDTSDFYSWGASEEAFGEASAALCRREEYVISTKVGVPVGKSPNQRGSSRKHIREGIDASLRRLKTDYVDLYLLHVWDSGTPLEETMDALEDAVRAGKVLYYGVSNFRAWQTAHAQHLSLQQGGRGLAATQLQYNLAYREEEREALPYCGMAGIGVMVYSPLARGWLVGSDEPAAALTERERTRVDQDVKSHALYGCESDRSVRARLRQVASQRGVPPGQVALAWLHAKPQVSSVIVGALEPHHLADAIASLDIRLDAQETAWLEEAYVPGALRTEGFNQVLEQQKKASLQAGLDAGSVPKAKEIAP